VDREGGRLAPYHAAAVLGEAHLGPFHLAGAGLTTQLPEDLADLGYARGTDGVALGDEASAGVDGLLAS